jgi:glycosyl transferase family 1
MTPTDPSVMSGTWAGARILVLSPTPTHPQDYGNRKRVNQICRHYADEGARITFLHYPSELEWRDTLPWRAERAMSQAWDQYYTISPKRLLHTNPQGAYHGIDEWWDEAIGDFLKWLFSVQSFDAFIVNYSWLSKAFEYAPRAVFKILDTNDKVSGRRELLESLGLDPEFFYTTEGEEKIALRRADLVWAIKEEEKLLFEKMSATPVVALPHVDPARAIERPAPDPDGYLRVGIIGARNNINWINIGEFLKVAEPVFKEQFAPVKIVIAGSVCDLLKGAKSPYVELCGRVETVDEFYKTVDCVAVPMRLSTGLKIKTGEALSLGLPVVSLAHAFEGYRPTDKLHTLADFADMAKAIADLSFQPRARLDALALASRLSHGETSSHIALAFRQSDLIARDKRRMIVMAVDSRAFVPGTIFNLVLASVQEYLRNLANLTILVVRGSAADLAGHVSVVDRFRRVVAAQDLDGMDAEREALAEIGVEVVEVETYLRRMQPKVMIAEALHPALQKASAPDAVVISRSEMIALSEGKADFSVPGKGYRRAFVAAPALSRDVARHMADAGGDCLLEPCFWRSGQVSELRGKVSGDIKTVALLGNPAAPAVVMASAMVKAWRMTPYLVCGLADDADEASKALSIPAVRADDYVGDLVSGRRPQPTFSIDLSAGRLGLQLVRELLERLHIPVVTAQEGTVHSYLDIGVYPLQAPTERSLWDAVRSLAMDGDETRAPLLKEIWQEHESDRGWAWLWRYCVRLFETNDAEFA